MKNLTWRLVLVGAVIVVAIVYIVPTIVALQTGNKEDTPWPHKLINLGLDLQGGMHLVLEVESDKAVEGFMERKQHEMRDSLREGKIRYRDLERVNDQVQVLVLAESADEFRAMLDDEFRDLKVDGPIRKDEGDFYSLSLPDEEKTRISRSSVDQALEIIRNRVDTIGVSEPDIRRQGERRILVQLPGIKDANRAKDLIGQTAQLEFKLVDDTHELSDALDGQVPPGSEVLDYEHMNRQTDRLIKDKLLINKKTLLTGDYLTEARVQFDSQFGSPYVAIKFDKKGGQIFAMVTGQNKGKRLAIVLDNVVKSAPVIRSRITGGEAIIEGDFTSDEAHDLAIVLRTALPAPVVILEERTVGPSLGHDSIRKGLTTMVIGGLLVVFFMLIYYKGSGLVADLALVLNVVFLAAGLALFQATLTLPGIAGIILTIGMAVDANVLIFERIREEMRKGSSPAASVETGYQKATLTILDANVTTLVAALVLFQFGTGPVKGFAVTLSLGIISSLFTAIVVTRIVFDYFLFNRRVRSLSI